MLKETLHPTTASNGSYSTALLGVGVGKWRVKAVLPPSETVEGSESAYSEFEIKPGLCQTNSYLTPGVPFNGQPGYISVSGSVQVPNPECGIVNGQYVNVNFSKNEGGVYVYKGTAHATVYNGSYSVANWTVGTGNWRARRFFKLRTDLRNRNPANISSQGWPTAGIPATSAAGRASTIQRCRQAAPTSSTSSSGAWMATSGRCGPRVSAGTAGSSSPSYRSARDPVRYRCGAPLGWISCPGWWMGRSATGGTASSVTVKGETSETWGYFAFYEKAPSRRRVSRQ